uniref:Head maturation protease n=1 Tax=Xanthomonas phage MK21 TaxID=3148942 RepID=A0AAU7J7U5_9CAUD
MSKRMGLPEAPKGKISTCKSSINEAAKAKWQGSPQAAVMTGRTIDIYGEIGEDMFAEGTTSAQISAFLRDAGPGDITVNIDSPGGDMFAGMAIYNQLRAHEGQVTVNVVGTAASAASVIAMAGDVVHMHPSAFLMLHCCWLISAGNRKDFLSLAETMVPFDAAMAEIYAARTGKPVSEIEHVMDAETWFNAKEAVAFGLADSILEKENRSKRIAASAAKPEVNITALNALALQLQLLKL